MATRMPPDKLSTPNSGRAPAAPLGPGLHRAVGKVGPAVLSPKLATFRPGTALSQASAPSPMIRRAMTEQQTAPTQSGGGTPVRLTTWASRDDLGSVVGGSFARQKQPPTSTTPTTPIATDRSTTWEQRSGLGISYAAANSDVQRRQQQFVTLGSPVAAGDDGDGPGREGDGKFFYASDAKSQQTTVSRNQAQQRSGPTFFYANGESVEKGPSQPPPPPPPPPGPPLAQSVISMSTPSRTLPARTAPLHSGTVGVSVHRPPSPVKGTPQPASSPIVRNAPTSPYGTSSRSPVVGGPASIQSTAVHRPASLVGSHSRSGSVVSVGNNAGHAPAKAIPRTATAEALSPTSSLSPPLVAESVVQTKDVTSEPVGTAVPDTVDGIPISPSKSCYPPDAINDLVANARRERKVQDLEITNASLEAINRTLERQLRKQTSELRRYRRLSRSGRLSLPLALSRRDVSGGSASQSGATDMGSILEEEDAEDDDDRLDEDDLEPYDSGDDSSDYGSTSAGSSNLSPTNSTSAASRALRIRRRDEKRLQLDLSRHQQLLVDSQKMNQSLKRCIDWTEELIREGRRALAYYVPVSDVQLGGRVLAAPDEDDEDDEADEAGGPDEGGDEDHHYLEQEQEQHNADLQPSSPLREGEKEEWSDPNEVKDRDSGIELAEA